MRCSFLKILSKESFVTIMLCYWPFQMIHSFSEYYISMSVHFSEFFAIAFCIPPTHTLTRHQFFLQYPVSRCLSSMVPRLHMKNLKNHHVSHSIWPTFKFIWLGSSRTYSQVLPSHPRVWSRSRYNSLA